MSYPITYSVGAEGSFLGDKKRLGHETDLPLHLLAKLRMSGATPLFLVMPWWLAEGPLLCQLLQNIWLAFIIFVLVPAVITVQTHCIRHGPGWTTRLWFLTVEYHVQFFMTSCEVHGSQYGTCPHFSPQCGTSPHFSPSFFGFLQLFNVPPLFRAYSSSLHQACGISDIIRIIRSLVISWWSHWKFSTGLSQIKKLLLF